VKQETSTGLSLGWDGWPQMTVSGLWGESKYHWATHYPGCTHWSV